MLAVCGTQGRVRHTQGRVTFRVTAVCGRVVAVWRPCGTRRAVYSAVRVTIRVTVRVAVRVAGPQDFFPWPRGFPHLNSPCLIYSRTLFLCQRTLGSSWGAGALDLPTLFISAPYFPHLIVASGLYTVLQQTILIGRKSDAGALSPLLGGEYERG